MDNLIYFTITHPDLPPLRLSKKQSILLEHLCRLMKLINEMCQNDDSDLLEFTFTFDEGTLELALPNPRSPENIGHREYTIQTYIYNITHYEADNDIAMTTDAIQISYIDLFAPIIQKQCLFLFQQSPNLAVDFILSDYIYGIFVDFNDDINERYFNGLLNNDLHIMRYLIEQYQGIVTNFHRRAIINTFIIGELDLVIDYKNMIPILTNKNLDSPDLCNISFIIEEVSLEQFIFLLNRVKTNYPSIKLSNHYRDYYPSADMADIDLEPQTKLQKQKLIALYQYDMLDKQLLGNVGIIDLIAGIKQQSSVLFDQLEQAWLYDPVILHRVIEFIIDQSEREGLEQKLDELNIGVNEDDEKASIHEDDIVDDGEFSPEIDEEVDFEDDA